MFRRLLSPLLAAASLGFSGSVPGQTSAHVASSVAAALSPLTNEALAIVINDNDSASVDVGKLYAEKRKISAKNIVHVQLPVKQTKLSPAEFQSLKQRIDSQLAPDVRAVLFVWTAPYAVECNSITSAYTLGYDARQCSNICGPGEPSPYFNLPRMSSALHSARLSMLLPVHSMEVATDVINRGVQSGFSLRNASAYYLKTSDKARSSRAMYFPGSGELPAKRLKVRTLVADSIRDKDDVMIYQTGLETVPDLNTLRFMPGALADHLTSTGGDLLRTTQMSSLRWLEAGATASYGTVSEPCNYWQKFPQSSVLLRNYLNGDTAIEAYWKSVAWPAQGLFIGEPLAAPYRSGTH